MKRFVLINLVAADEHGWYAIRKQIFWWQWESILKSLDPTAEATCLNLTATS